MEKEDATHCENTPLFQHSEDGSDWMKPGFGIFSAIWVKDPARSFMKGLFLAGTAVGLGLAIALADILESIIPPSKINWSVYQTLLSTSQAAIGASPDMIIASWLGSGSVFLALFIADILGLLWPANWRSWKGSSTSIENSEISFSSCYEEMFCEPGRENALIARPGNTVSNLIFLFTGLLVVQSV